MKEDKVLDAIISIVSKELKGIESKLAAPEINAMEKLKPGIEKAVSYTHLTLPTNREV